MRTSLGQKFPPSLSFIPTYALTFNRKTWLYLLLYNFLVWLRVGLNLLDLIDSNDYVYIWDTIILLSWEYATSFLNYIVFDSSFKLGVFVYHMRKR